MSYYIAKKVHGAFSEVISRVKSALQTEGFGVLTEIDVQYTLESKLAKSFRPYVILGACNPELAYGALQLEDKIGVMLPCNVIVQENDAGVEVAAVDPLASIGRVGSAKLQKTAEEVKQRLQRAVAAV